MIEVEYWKKLQMLQYRLSGVTKLFKGLARYGLNWSPKYANETSFFSRASPMFLTLDGGIVKTVFSGLRMSAYALVPSP
jgi:hypothetical protein